MIKIAFVDSSRLISDTMRTVFSQEDDIYVTGCATTVEEALFLMPHSHVALLNTSLGRDKVLELTGTICAEYPDVKVIVAGLSCESEEILRYVEAGAMGYVRQEESLVSLLKKIRAASRGRAIVSPDFAAEMMMRLAQLASRPARRLLVNQPAVAELTSREEEILQLISDGYTNSKIADELVIQCGTVKNHVHNILKKLEARSRHDAALLYQHYQEMQGVAA
ncbi:MAG: response regulator transcription factor [Chloroflexota bacterium]